MTKEDWEPSTTNQRKRNDMRERHLHDPPTGTEEKMNTNMFCTAGAINRITGDTFKGEYRNFQI